MTLRNLYFYSFFHAWSSPNTLTKEFFTEVERDIFIFTWKAINL